MRIRDISLADIRDGKNWRVINPDNVRKDGFAMEDLEIESLENYKEGEKVVYSGILVYLERPARELRKLRRLGERRALKENPYPPDYPKDLLPNVKVKIKPLLMVKLIDIQCWDYLEYVHGEWRQVGLKRDPNPPFGNEFFADPIYEDCWFDVCDDEGPIRELHKRAFREWISYMEP